MHLQSYKCKIIIIIVKKASCSERSEQKPQHAASKNQEQLKDITGLQHKEDKYQEEEYENGKYLD